jgi:hypothetical protein
MVSDKRIQREVVDANTIFRLTGNWTTASLALLEDEVRHIVAAASSITSPLKFDASEIESHPFSRSDEEMMVNTHIHTHFLAPFLSER